MGKVFEKLSTKIFAIATTVVTAISMISPLGVTNASALGSADDWGVLYDKGLSHFGAGYSTSSRLGPSTFDCSGFVDYLFNEAGIDSTPYNGAWVTSDWCNELEGMGLSYSDATQDTMSSVSVNKGDIIMFYSNASRTAASSVHMGVLADNNHMISAVYVGVVEQGLYSSIVSDIDGKSHQYDPSGSKAGTYVRVYHMPSGFTVNVNLAKASANISITGGNASYSLQGAVYGIYGSQADANSNSNALASITTGADGKGTASIKVGNSTSELWYRELTAPKGYLIDSNAYRFDVSKTNSNPTINISEVPGADPLTISLYKKNEDLPSDSETVASMEGAQFTINYYDEQYSSVNELPGSPKYTWIIETKAETTDNGIQFIAKLDDAHLVSGSSALIKNSNGGVVIPLGTITVEETKVPNIQFEGNDVYTLNNKTLDTNGAIISENSKALFNIKLNQSASGVNMIATNGTTSNNNSVIETPVQNKNYFLKKVDAETVSADAQGNATLTGGKYQVINNNSWSVKSYVTGGAVAKGGVVMEVSLQDGSFTGTDYPLTVGSYIFKEIEAPTGYTLSGDTEVEFKILNANDAVTATVDDEVIRGGFKFQKQDIETGTYAQGDTNLQSTLKITNTGANPVWVDTNGDGICTSDEMYANGQTINLPSSAVVKGTVNSDGTFTTTKDGEFEITADVLPYSSYHIEEVIAPTGYRLDNGSITETDFDITEDGQIVDLTNTIKNVPITGKFDIQKMLSSENNGMSTTSKPEAGVEFTAFLKATVDEKFGGDYKAAYEYAFKQKANVAGNATPDDSGTIYAEDGSILFTTKEYDVVTTNNSGMAYSRDLAYGEYYIFQSSHSDSIQDYEGNVTTYEGTTFNVSEADQATIHFYVTNVPMLYKLKMVKISEQTGEKISLNTTTFRITDKDGNVVKQKIGNKVYDAFTTTTHQMVVDDADGKKITVDTGTFVSEQPSEEDEGVSYTALGLEAGTYYISEIKTPSGFKTLEEPIEVVIKESSITEVDSHGENIIEVTIPDTQITGGFSVSKKVDEWDADTELFDPKDLSGVGFTLTAAEDIIDPANGEVLVKAGEGAVKLTNDTTTKYEEVGEVFCDKNGDFTIADLPLGKYTLKETTVPNGLVLDETEHTVEIKESSDEKALTYVDNALVTEDDTYLDAFNITNKLTKTEITKSDLTTSKEIEGVKMELRHGDDVIDSWTSTKEAHKISGLTQGETYTLVEVSTIPGYYYSEDVTFTVSEEMTKVEMKDAPIKYQIEKVDENGKPVVGVTLELYDVTKDDEGNYVNVDENGSPAKIELPNEGVTTGEPFVLDCVLEAGHNYKLVESEYVAGLYKATDIYFNVNMIGTSDTVTITMVDETADVVVRKLDQYGNAIAGAKMQIIEAQLEPGTETTDDEAVKDDTALDDDAYTLDESTDEATETTDEETSDEADIDIQELDADVDDDEATKEVVADDDQEATKQDATDVIDEEYTISDKELSYVPVKNEDGTDKVVYEFVTTDDAEGVDISDYVKGDGTYILREVEAPYGYKTTQDQAFVVTGTGASTQVLIAIDMPETYDIDVKKVDASDNTVTLEGAVFRLYNATTGDAVGDEEGNYIEATSNKEGIATFTVEYDPEGYYIKEVKSPNGYNINENKFAVTLAEDFFTKEELVYELTVTDEKIPTAAGMGTGLVIAGLASLTGLSAAYTLKKKKNEDDENAE